MIDTEALETKNIAPDLSCKSGMRNVDLAVGFHQIFFYALVNDQNLGHLQIRLGPDPACAVAN